MYIARHTYNVDISSVFIHTKGLVHDHVLEIIGRSITGKQRDNVRRGSDYPGHASSNNSGLPFLRDYKINAGVTVMKVKCNIQSMAIMCSCVQWIFSEVKYIF